MRRQDHLPSITGIRHGCFLYFARREVGKIDWELEDESNANEVGPRKAHIRNQDV